MLRVFEPLEHGTVTHPGAPFLPGHQTAAQGVGNGFGLFKNLLEHIVRETAQFRRLGFPLDLLRLPLDRFIG